MYEQNVCLPEGPTPAEDAEAQRRAELERQRSIDLPLEQDAYDNGIMSLFGGLGSGLIKGGIVGLGRALVTGPRAQARKALAVRELGKLLGGDGDKGSTEGAGGANGSSAGKQDGAEGARGY